MLVRKPDDFPRVPFTAIRRAKTRPFPPSIPSFGIFFEHNDTTITLKYIYRMDFLD